MVMRLPNHCLALDSIAMFPCIPGTKDGQVGATPKTGKL